MKTFTIYLVYLVGDGRITISAYDYFIDSLGVITFVDEDKKPVAVFSMSNIVGFCIE